MFSRLLLVSIIVAASARLLRRKPVNVENSYGEMNKLRPKMCQTVGNFDDQVFSPKYFCPTPATDGEWPCVSYSQLCDQTPDCPGREDESPGICMFHLMRAAEITSLRERIDKLRTLTAV